MFQIPQISFPYRASYLAVIMLIACTLPLYLATLPSAITLLIISLFFGILIVLKKGIFPIYAFIFTITFSFFVHQAQQHKENLLDFENAKKQFVIVARIIDFPKKNNTVGKTNITLKIRLNADVMTNDGHIVLRKDSLLKITCYRCETMFSLGDVWQFQTKLKPPLGSASWGAFDYEKYAFANRIVATGHLQEKSANKLYSHKSLINSFRKNIHSILEENLADQNLSNKQDAVVKQQKLRKDNLALLQALIVGDRTQLKAEHWKQFRNTGTSHLMSISGLHITLVFFLVSFLIRFIVDFFLKTLPVALSRWLMEQLFYRIDLSTFSMLCALIAASLYALTTGLSVPTQRAILMLTIICVTRLYSKKISLIEALSTAIIVILLFFPLSTLHSGFWLSAIAVFMIGILIKSRDTKWLLHCRMALAMIPVTLIYFNSAPLISPLANILLIPLVSIVVLPFSLFLVLLNLIATELFSNFDAISGFFEYAWQLLNMSVDLVWYLLKLFSTWQLLIHEYMSLSIPSNGLSTSFIILVIILVLVWRLAFARSLLILPLIVFLLIEPKESLREGEFSMTILDVGQGLAIILETRRNYIVFDTGIGFLESDSAERIIMPFVNYQGFKPVSHIIVSHADNDHIGGLQTLTKYFPSTPVLIGGIDNLTSISNVKNTSPCYAKKWQQEGIMFQIFPEIQVTASDRKRYKAINFSKRKSQLKKLKRNNRSCVMKVSSKYGSVLLPADIERLSEHVLAQNHPLAIKADVLVAAHHGSRTSSTPAFLNKVNPDIVIISASYFSPYGHPHEDALQRLQKYAKKVLTTGRSGSIKIDFVKDGRQRREFRALHPRFWYSEHLN